MAKVEDLDEHMKLSIFRNVVMVVAGYPIDVYPHHVDRLYQELENRGLAGVIGEFEKWFLNLLIPERTKAKMQAIINNRKLIGEK